MNEEKKRGLAYVRGRVAAGKHKAADVKRWKGELGDELVDAILEELAPKKPAASKAGDSKE